MIYKQLYECMSYVALEAITSKSLNMIVANEGAQTRPYQYYVTVCLSVPPSKQFREAPVITVQRFVCLSFAIMTSQGNGYYCQDGFLLTSTGCTVSAPAEPNNSTMDLRGFRRAITI